MKKNTFPNGDEFFKGHLPDLLLVHGRVLASQQKKDDDEMMEGSRLVFSSPFFRRLILARHLVPSASASARCRTKALKRFARTHSMHAHARARTTAVN